MAQPTQQYKRSLSGSVGSGMKSVFGSSGRRYYVLEHRVSSAYHKAGESQKIIVDQIELGRDPSCQVRFDESFQTVSRRHAAIVKDGDNWKLVQLSHTNSTYLNGHKVTNEWYLQNGDEIQLSTNGPKLGFIVPQGDKSLVKSIGLTDRLNLFRQQALRPYKMALTILSCIFVIAVGLGAFFLTKANQENRRLDKLVAEQKAQMERDKAQTDSVIVDLVKQNAQLKKDIRKIRNNKPAPPVPKPIPIGSSEIDCNVYYIQTQSCTITLDGEVTSLSCASGEAPAWSGTGFMLDNGRFVTARHVIEAWYYWLQGNEPDEKMLTLNAIVNNGGKVVYHFVAVNGKGEKFTFTSDQFSVYRGADITKETDEGIVVSHASETRYDYAYANISRPGGLAFDKEMSESLKRGVQLTVYGYPLGLGAGDKPLMGKAMVSAEGLMEGVIMTTDTDFEHGNSGGPVFYSPEEGKFVVVGIVSAVMGRQAGQVIPISCIK